MKHKKIMFFIYMGTLVTHGKKTIPPPSSPITHKLINYREKRSKTAEKKVRKTLKVVLMEMCR
jgi:hypothetical protein